VQTPPRRTLIPAHICLPMQPSPNHLARVRALNDLRGSRAVVTSWPNRAANFGPAADRARPGYLTQSRLASSSTNRAATRETTDCGEGELVVAQVGIHRRHCSSYEPEYCASANCWESSGGRAEGLGSLATWVDGRNQG
jgi:hypothetical protein